MSKSPITTLFAAKYSSIDRWSNYGKLFNGYHMRPEYYFILFNFMDGIHPHPNSIKGLENFGEHYEVCKLEGMSVEDQAKIITHRINQKSCAEIKVVLIDLEEFESIYTEIEGFSLESRKTIASKTARTIFDPRQMKDNRARRHAKYINDVPCGSIEIEDSAIRQEENAQQRMKEDLIREAKQGTKHNFSKENPIDSIDSRDEGKKTKNTIEKGERQKKNKNQGYRHSNSSSKSNDVVPEESLSDSKQEEIATISSAVNDSIGFLFNDTISAFTAPADNNLNDTPQHFRQNRNGKNSNFKDQFTEKIPIHNTTQSTSEKQSGFRKDSSDLAKEIKQKTLERKRKSIERQVFGTNSISAEDHMMRFSEYENTRAELVNLRIQQFIDNLERAIPILKKKELSYEHYSKLLITFVISDDAQSFIANWGAMEPSKDFKIDDQQFLTFKSEAIFIQKLSDTLFSDSWIS